MAKIALTGGFSVIPEGAHIFKITEVSYKETFGKLEVKMVTADGQMHTERFSLIGANGQPNNGAMKAFSFFAKTALNDFNLTEIDHNDLVGHYIECVVEHETKPSTKDPSKNVTFVHLTEKYPAVGFGGTASATTTPANTSNGGINLDALLG